MEQLDLLDIYRALHPQNPEYTFFSNAHETLSRMDHTLGHKICLNKFKRIEIISSIFSDHKGVKLEINHKKRNEKKMITWRLKNMLQKPMGRWCNQRGNQKIPWNIWYKNTTIKNLWHAAKEVLIRKEIIKIKEKINTI